MRRSSKILSISTNIHSIKIKKISHNKKGITTTNKVYTATVNFTLN